MTNSRSGRLVIHAIITAIGYLIVQLDVTIVNVALPTIKNAFGTGVGDLQWIPDAYVIIYAALLLVSGSLSDRFGARNIHLLGLLIFSVSSYICASATDLTAMIAGRVIQGIGAALILPSSLALLTHATQGNAIAKTKAIGLWSAIGGIVSATGPFIGGLLIGYYPWQVIFWINIPICIVGMAAVYFCLPATKHAHLNRVDYIGGTYVAVLCFSFVYILSVMGKPGDHLVHILVAFGIFIVFLGMTYRHLKRGENVFFPLELMKNSIVYSSMIIGSLTNFAFYGSIFLITVYFQVFRHFSAIQTGLALLAFVIIGLANSSSSKLRALWGTRATLCLGLMVSTVAYVMLSILIFVKAEYSSFVLCLFLMPLGTGFATPVLISVFLEAIPSHLSATASAAINAARQVGGAIGVAVVGLLLSNSIVSLETGAIVGFIFAACALLTGLIIIQLNIRNL